MTFAGRLRWFLGRLISPVRDTGDVAPQEDRSPADPAQDDARDDTDDR